MTASKHNVNPVERTSTVAVAKNQHTMACARIIVSLLAGVGAGILGIENWYGIIFYIIVQLIFSALLYIRLESNVKQYFQSTSGFVWNGFTAGGMTFVLFWTLLYDIVYIY